MADLEAKAEDQAEQWDRALATVNEMSAAWQAADKALDEESVVRRKAEAVGRVVDKIVVTFEPTGRRYPVGIVKRIEIVPRMGGERDFRTCESESPGKSSRTSTEWP
jgi:hypothetical protein